MKADTKTNEVCGNGDVVVAATPISFTLAYSNLDGGNYVDTDNLIRVSSEKSRSISRPRQASAMRSPGMSSSLLVTQVKLLRPQGVNNNLRLQIPNLDAFVSSSTQPVPVGREYQGVDNFTSIKRVKTLALIKIPKHGSSVLSSRGTKRTIGRNTHSVEVSSVSNEVVAEFAVGQGPDLDETIPSTRDNERDALGGRETDAGYPLGMALGIRSNGVFAFSEGVPQFDGLITRPTDDLTVVHAEGHREDVLGVSHETTSGTPRVNLPKTEGSIPTSRKSKLSITRDDDITHKVRVSTKSTLGVTVGIVFTGVGVGEAPDHDGFVTGSREDEVGVLGGGGDGCDPVAVTAEGSS
jgi:hypothetical protein